MNNYQKLKQRRLEKFAIACAIIAVVWLTSAALTTVSYRALNTSPTPSFWRYTWALGTLFFFGFLLVALMAATIHASKKQTGSHIARS